MYTYYTIRPRDELSALAHVGCSPGNVANEAIGIRAVFRRHLLCWVVLWPAFVRRARAAWPDTLVYGLAPASVPDKRLGAVASKLPGRVASCASARLGLAIGPAASGGLPGTQYTGLQLPPGCNAPANAPSRVLWQ